MNPARHAFLPAHEDCDSTSSRFKLCCLLPYRKYIQRAAQGSLIRAFQLTPLTQRSDPSAVDFRARTLEALNRQSSREDAARDVAKGGLPSDFRGASRSRNQDKQAPLDIPVPAKDAQKAAGDKSMAGRKQPMGGERWDMATGKEAPMHRDKEEDTDDKREETPEEHEVETELNSILKRGPSQ